MRVAAAAVEIEAPSGTVAPTRREVGLCTVVLGAAALARILLASRYRVNGDEPQHLHVVWGWTVGLLQYRDVFDNHMPLFDVLCAPLLRLVGERPDVFVPMRLAMLPLWAASLWAVHRIGRVVFDRRVALWAVTLTAVDPTFFLRSLEFRPDDLWAALWLLVLVVLCERPIGVRPALVAGLLLGVMIGVSLKTVVLLPALAGGLVGAIAVTGVADRNELGRVVAASVACVAAAAVVPLAIAAFFAAAGALDVFLYGNYGHNHLPGLAGETIGAARWLVAGVLLVVAAAWASRQRRDEPETTRRRVFLVIVTVISFVTLVGIWPLPQRQNRLPLDPLLAVVGAAALCAIDRRALGPTTAALVLGAGLVGDGGPKHWSRDQEKLLAAVLRLTTPDDRVMDVKGETVYRRRPYWWTFEDVTRRRLDRGLLVDAVPEALVATATPVTVTDVAKFPPRARDFVLRNYLAIGPLRVVARRLGAAAPGAAIEFSIAIPASYALVGTERRPTGILDGTPYDGPRPLAVGTHVYVPVRDEGRLTLWWSRAVERGFVR